jgi:hypothetical protein
MLKATPSKGAPLRLLLAWQLPTMPALSNFRQIAIAETGELESRMLAPDVAWAASPKVGAVVSPVSTLREERNQNPTAPKTSPAATTSAILFCDSMSAG